MATGSAKTQVQFADARLLLGDRLPKGSIYRLLADDGAHLFGDDYFADLYKDSPRGRPTIPARVIATVMLLQSFEGLSDREACDRLGFDLKWQAAAGLPAAAEAFHPTVLVGMRNRLRASERPRRLFEDTVALAKRSGVLKGRTRVLDSTPLLDAVATQDTVTMLRAAIRGLLRTASGEQQATIRAALSRDDDYQAPGKPSCDWDDPAAREQLVDALVRDAAAALGAIEGAKLDPITAQAAELLGVVAGQDVAQGDDGVFRIVRGTARDRTISTADPQARHGHKTAAKRFDGYKTHIAVEPGTEIFTGVAASAANVTDAAVIDELLDDEQQDEQQNEEQNEPVQIVADGAYASGATLEDMRQRGIEMTVKVPPVRNPKGFSKDLFAVDMQAKTVSCPAGHTAAIHTTDKGSKASFAQHCGACPLRAKCTKARAGRTITINDHEAVLQEAKKRQRTPEFIARYKAIRPKVERKIAHFVRKPWGGRKARCRGLERIATDVDTRAGVLNLARLAGFGLRFTATGWATG